MENNDAIKKRFIYMTETPVPKLITTLAVPTIISMLVTSLYNMADTFFVGRISTQATAAVGIVFSVMAVIQAFGFFCGHGSGNSMSRFLGTGDTKSAQEMASTGFALSFLLGATLTVFGLINLDALAKALGATPTIMAETKAYLRIILIGAPFTTSQFVINNQLRFQGSAMYSMVGLVSGAIINIALDPIFIFGFGLGVAGAAAATVMSQMIAFTILMIGSFRGPNIHVSLRTIRFNRRYLLGIVNGGAPSLARQGLASMAAIVMNYAAGGIGGDAAIAGLSVVNRVMMFMFYALIGFGQGYQPVCGFNYGAGLYSRVKEGYFFCVKYGTILFLILGTLCALFSPQIIGFFRDDPDVIAVGAKALRFTAFAFPLNATIVITNMLLQSIGKGVRATLLATCRSGLYYIPLMLIFPGILGILGIEITQMCADILTFLTAVPFARSILKELSE